ncbi:uncharacterized protein LOC128016040 [Carassius gibelio]|uniref:uncharacterized protein LOC128016040 n=1 Tax=Carassius gibelio TaxID=101364 RepID=UPI002278DC38|nr:uncharacterized protein LOC128016040 [Carassius gibelio]
MATSRDYYEGEQVPDPRPSRTRRVPTYLEDYVLDYPHLMHAHPSPADGTQGIPNVSQDPYKGYITPPPLERDFEGGNLHHLEARWRDLSSEMRELQIRMDSARQASFASRSPVYAHYKSISQAELKNMGLQPSMTVASSPHYEETLYHEPPMQQRPQSSMQPSNIARVASLPGPKPQRLLSELRRADSWPPTAAQPAHPQIQHQPSLIQPAPSRVQPQRQPVAAQSVPVTLPPQYQQTVPAPVQPVPIQPTMHLHHPFQPPPPPPRPGPQSQHYHPTNNVTPGLMEMVIASSYGIPKPRLAVFSSGKESDFLMLKKGLDSVLGPHRHLTEDYKYQVLLDHLHLPAAYQVAKRYVNSPYPYTSAMQALEQRYGQPRQLIQSELRAILNAPAIRPGDAQGFEDFAAAVNTLVGMLNTMEGPSRYELQCGSHVDTLLTKLPVSYRDSFIEYCLNQHIIMSGSSRTYTLSEFSEWLERKSQAIQISRRVTGPVQPEAFRREQKFLPHSKAKSATILTGSEQPQAINLPSSSSTGSKMAATAKKQDRFKPFCPFCNNHEHYLNACPAFCRLNHTQRGSWVKDHNKCWRCGRGHKPDSCTLKRACSTCGGLHLPVLHEVAVAVENQSILTVSTTNSQVYLDQTSHSGRVMLKVVPVRLRSGKRFLDTHAVLDDGSEKTIILPAAAKHLHLEGPEEVLALRTIRHDLVHLRGTTVSFEVSALSHLNVKHQIHKAFTAADLNLAEQSCPVDTLKRRYGHLRDIPLQSFTKVQPLLLIGSDYPQLITPNCPIRMGPLGSPIAVHTQLGWTVQGPTTFFQQPSNISSCLHTTFLSPTQELRQHVERLWQLDILPSRNEKEVVRSKQDKAALAMLEQKTVQVTVDGVNRYATPLLRKVDAPKFQASPNAVMALLRATERRLIKDTNLANVYNKEIHKLEEAGYAVRITSAEAANSTESWFVPHHIVHHNGKDRVVFNCSFSHLQTNLNDNLLPGPTLGPPLLGVLLRFRQHAVAISGDIRAMFHQIRLLPEDQPLLRFLWRDMERERSPDIYEWRVLPFGTTCSPCCATYALQRHVRDNTEGNEEVVESIQQSFYVDNCLQSLQCQHQAKKLIDKMRTLLNTGGFDIRQWASNVPDVIAHLPFEAKSEGCELWLSANKTDPQESALGLMWHCSQDTFSYKHRPVSTNGETSMRTVYRILASQYDPLGYIIPFTTRAKILVQTLWKRVESWDEPLPADLLSEWHAWEEELPNLQKITIPRCYTPACNNTSSTLDIHVFCDASEKAYGSVAYLRAETDDSIQVVFIMARSRVAPKKQLSVPRLELCAALSGAQLAKTLNSELTLNIRQTVMWSDSTTVLHWINSESCTYKVFVGTRIAEIQDLVGCENWNYVDSDNNPADDITRGKTLTDLSHTCRWNQGPEFLQQSPDHWPIHPSVPVEDSDELRKSKFCGNVSINHTSLPNVDNCKSWDNLIMTTYEFLHGAAAPPMSATDRIETEMAVLKRAQTESFPDEVHALQANKPVHSNSRLSSLAPALDPDLGLIRVGGRLRKAATLPEDALHPIVLAPEHPITKLLIQDFDNRLMHAGPERVFAELRRTYWVLRGRQMVKKHQRQCAECRKWRGKPVIPKMADIPVSRLRINQPPFWSTGMDCFGPYVIKIGRRQEKRWGIIFKCLTTRCVHLDLLCNMDADSFLLALRRFIARRGKPFELICDRGTNFRGGERELSEAFAEMEPSLREQLANQKISFIFNPPHAPHFGGVWEREIKSVKASLQVVLKDHTFSEEVLSTVLIEVEGILNSKPLGYVSSDIADPDPITPNLLLMGRRDASLPQAVYGPSNLLGRRRYRHSQVIADHFWTQFLRNYLPSLQLRQKWQNITPNLAVDQVVLIADSQLPRAQWPVGKITRVLPSDDGAIRAAEVDIKGNTYIRPVAKLIVLPEMPEN